MSTNYQPDRTLADMTPEEREQCWGMWCKLSDGSTGILAACDETYTGDHPRLAMIIGPSEDGKAVLINRCEMQEITPLFGTLRAWKPDGTLITADPEEYTVDERRMVDLMDLGGVQRVGYDPGTRICRWITEWEAINEELEGTL